MLKGSCGDIGSVHMKLGKTQFQISRGCCLLENIFNIAIRMSTGSLASKLLFAII